VQKQMLGEVKNWIII